MKFTKAPARFSYQASQFKELFRFTVTRLSDNKESHVDRKPRKDSKFWSYQFLIWDNQNNCLASK